MNTPLCGTCEVTTTDDIPVTRVIFSGTGSCYGSITFINSSQDSMKIIRNSDVVNALTLESGGRLTLTNDSICKLEVEFTGVAAETHTWDLYYKGCIYWDPACSCEV